MDASAKNYKLESFLTVLLEEVVKADMSMHDRQLEAWKHFSDHKPRGTKINANIDEGWAEQRYLSLNEVKFKFHARVVPESFRKRLMQAFRYVIRKYEPQAYLPRNIQLTDDEKPDSIEVTVIVKQEERGKLKLSYEPDNELTRSIFMTSPFLQGK